MFLSSSSSALAGLARQALSPAMLGEVLWRPGFLAAAATLLPSVAQHQCSSGFTTLAQPAAQPCQQQQPAISAIHAASSGLWGTGSQRAPPPPPPLQHQFRGFAAGGGSSAAVRRLRRAGSRVAASRGSVEAALTRQEEGSVEAGPTEDIVPVEGPASEVQVASVVGHPALIITRPIEWCAAWRRRDGGDRRRWDVRTYLELASAAPVQ